MRLALAQLNFTVGAFDANFAKIEAAVTRAREGGADLLILTELAATGYPPRDLVGHAADVTSRGGAVGPDDNLDENLMGRSIGVTVSSVSTPPVRIDTSEPAP